MFKTREVFKMLKLSGVSTPPFFGGGGGYTPTTFNIFNMFNISPVLSTFWVALLHFYIFNISLVLSVFFYFLGGGCLYPHSF